MLNYMITLTLALIFLKDSCYIPILNVCEQGHNQQQMCTH